MKLHVVVEAEALEPERYELREGPAYRFDLSRRGFLGLFGAGVLISVGKPIGAQSRSRPATAGSVNARIHLGTDGTITVLTGKVEFGQGSRSQLSQAAAEELRVDPETIRMIMADTRLVPNDGGTWGSQTTPRTVPAVRRAAAAARQILLDLASREWQIDVSRLEVVDGTVAESAVADSTGADEAAGRTLTYADLAGRTDLYTELEQSVPADVALTPVAEWQQLGKSRRAVRSREIVTGSHRYPSDVRREGMLYGKVVRPPSLRAIAIRIDLEPAEALGNVTAVHEGAFVGVVAPTSYLAGKAAAAVARASRWEEEPHPPSNRIFSELREKAERGRRAERRPRVRERGDVDAALLTAHRRIAAEYEIAYIQHVPMEPRAAVAEWHDEGLTVWTGTQNPFGVRSELATAFRLGTDKVRVIVPDTGGGFGGKHTGECAIEAARLAKAAGRPVSLQWTREEELTWAYFRPAGVVSIKAGVDKRGSIEAWSYENINSGTAAMVAPYAWPHDRSSFVYCDAPLRQGSYRGIAATANNFARECFLDELAHAAEREPLQFRLDHLEDERLRDVLIAAAKRFDWQLKSAAGRKADRGIGIAGGTEKGSYVATCIEVEVDRSTGEVTVLDIVETFECGAICDQANVGAQVDGAIIMGLGGALWEETTFENGRILNDRLSKYRVPRFKDVPPITTVLLDRPDLPSVGCGETPIITLAPAIGNAIFDATGIRVRSMPLRSSKLRA